MYRSHRPTQPPQSFSPPRQHTYTHTLTGEGRGGHEGAGGAEEGSGGDGGDGAHGVGLWVLCVGLCVRVWWREAACESEAGVRSYMWCLLVVTSRWIGADTMRRRRPQAALWQELRIDDAHNRGHTIDPREAWLVIWRP